MKFDLGWSTRPQRQLGVKEWFAFEGINHQVVVIKIVDHQVAAIIFSIVLVVIPYGPELHNTQIKTASSENKCSSQFVNV